MENRNEDRNDGANEMALLANIMKVVITAVFILPLLHYSFYNEVKTLQESTEATNNTLAPNNTAQNITVPKRIIIKQPSCPISYLQVIFSEICEELFIKREMCTPEDIHNLDKHKLPKIIARNRSNHEPRGTLIGYLAAGLLLSSLGAAIVELYKAKSQTPAKTKPPLNRKCSLADLTVLKHNRKELVRRDSILEVPEDGGASKQLGRKVTRPPLRLD